MRLNLSDLYYHLTNSVKNKFFINCHVVGAITPCLAAFVMLLSASCAMWQIFFRVAIDRTHAQWVGAWWIGFILAGIWGVINSVFILNLPKEIPETDHYREDREKEMHKCAVEEKDSKFGKTLSSFCCSA